MVPRFILSGAPYLALNALARRSHVVAGLRVTHLVRSLDQVAQLGLRVVRGDATALVTEQILTILERHAGRAQPPTIRVFEIMDPNLPKPFDAGAPCRSAYCPE